MCRKFSFFVSFVLVLALAGNAFAVIGSQDIDNPGIPGSSSEAGGVWTIEGSGHDIWGGNDALHYVFRPMSGDGEMIARLVSHTSPSFWTKVGLMIRETLDDNSKQGAILDMGHPDDFKFTFRTTTGGGSADMTRSGLIPQKIKIVRSGDTIEGWIWEVVIPGVLEQYVMVGSVDIPMATDVFIGMAVCSHDNGVLATAEFDGVVWPAAAFNRPWNLQPADGTTKLPLTPTLSWMAGDSAVTHDVYFGTDAGALPLVASQALGDESYSPGTLDEATTYYWQIVEQPGDYASAVMSLKTTRTFTGTIDLCIWYDMGGVSVSDLTNNARYPENPDDCWEIDTLDSGTDLGDNYGLQIQGFLVPEISGTYTFWIASDDASQLWLSSSEKGCEAEVICKVSGWAGYHDYDGDPERKSAPVSLVGGQKYMIRALLKEGGGGDHVSVAWEGPDSPSRTEIDGFFLMTGFVERWASNPSVNGLVVTPLEAETLSFNAAPGATGHDVYFGETGSMALIATLPAGQTSVNVMVEDGKSYEWQVNEVFGAEVEEGCPWTFSVQLWISLDIGRANPNPAGSASFDAGTGVYTLKSGGNELWGGSDEFHYYYTTLDMTHDKKIDIQAQVLSNSNNNSWTRAGVMIRESTAANSRKVMAHNTGHDNTRMQWRDNPGDGTGNSGDNWDLGRPIWVRLTRDGSQFEGYRSKDGVNWTSLGSHSVSMDAGSKYITVGLALCHHNNQPQDQLTTVTFDNFSATSPDLRQAWGLDPANGATGVNIQATLRWNAGNGATEHRVYFSDDEDAVVNRTVAPVILPPETTELYVGPLDLTKTYYWAVDELVNPVIPGEVLSFTAENYRVIEDFESYDVPPEALPEQVFIAGAVLVEAVKPPAQEWVDPVVLVEALDPGTDCLVSRWDFEGDFTDSAGSNDGTPNGDVSIITDATRGDVASFDGDGDYVDCGNDASLNFSTGNWTICAWIKTSVTGRPKGHIIANGGDGGGGHRYALASAENKDDKLTLICDDNSSKKQSNSTTSITDGVWHHVVGLRNGDRQYLYVDGVLEDSDGLPAGYDLSGTSQRELLLGAIWHHKNNVIQKHYTGEIDDARVYNCALTAGNVRFLAGMGDLVKPGYYGPCIVHWAMDENSGSTVADSSGNGLDGTITDALWTATTADGSAACLDFEGGANVVSEAAGPYLENLGGLSISLWIQSDVIDTDKGFIIGRNPEGNDQRGMRYDTVGASSSGDDVIKFGVATNEGADESESSEMIQTTEWQHLVMVWDNDGTGTQLYVNGILNGLMFDGDNRAGLTNGYTKLLVGKGAKDGAADAGWDGRIDEVCVYDYRLSEGEVRYLAGIGNLALPDQYVPLLLSMEFEGNLDDSSGNDKHGTAFGAVSFETDPEKGEVLSLPGGNNQYVGIPPVGNFGNMPVTIACWAKADHTNIPDWTLVFGFTGNAGGGGGCGTHFNIGSLGGPGGVGAHAWCWESTIFTDDEALEWRHYAMTFDGGTIRYYGDGIQIGADGFDLSARADRVHIGSRVTQDSSFPGKVEDARVYDYPLTMGQIRTLANYVPTKALLSDTWSGRAAALPALEYQQSAHEGSQSMRVNYTGSGAVSRLEPFGDGKHPKGWNGDFSLGQAQALTLYFRGDPGNAPGTMFVQLTTVVPSGHTQRVLYNGDPEALMNPEWQEWNITLKALSTGKPATDVKEMGLPITKIKDVGVGIIGAGSGVLYFDDLRLYPARCVPEFGPAADLDDDCDVDRADTGKLLGLWLLQPGSPGLRYEYYEDWIFGGGLSGTDFDAATPTKSGVINNFDISVRDRNDRFGFRFTGVVVAPTSGAYTFYTSSDDGSMLFIDGALVVNNDGWHGMQWREGTLNLTAGEHSIEVQMFEDGGGEGLIVEVAGPGIPRTSIPDEILFLPDTDADLNGDGIVNFLDYADILNGFLDEILWPPSADWL